MATYTAAHSVHKTLSTTTVDTVTITGSRRVEVINRTGATALYLTTDGTAPVAAADDTEVVPTGTSVEVNVGEGGSVKIIGSGNAYSVTEVPT